MITAINAANRNNNIKNNINFKNNIGKIVEMSPLIADENIIRTIAQADSSLPIFSVLANALKISGDTIKERYPRLPFADLQVGIAASRVRTNGNQKDLDAAVRTLIAKHGLINQHGVFPNLVDSMTIQAGKDQIPNDLRHIRKVIIQEGVDLDAPRFTEVTINDVKAPNARVSARRATLNNATVDTLSVDSFAKLQNSIIASYVNAGWVDLAHVTGVGTVQAREKVTVLEYADAKIQSIQAQRLTVKKGGELEVTDKIGNPSKKLLHILVDGGSLKTDAAYSKGLSCHDGGSFDTRVWAIDEAPLWQRLKWGFQTINPFK